MLQCVALCVAGMLQCVARLCLYAHVCTHIHPIADRVALNLKIIFKKNSTNQNFAHGIYSYQVINDKSHENPGTLGIKLKFARSKVEVISKISATLSAIECISYMHSSYLSFIAYMYRYLHLA